ncbi:MAG: hypothetical protein ACRDDH_09210 [Cetobacterium sp.]|uniref:hypothetical protein n=1 Tax=Cetobacterium sp. TaxID=2071632 RepID=UPI003EE574D9
MISKDDVITLAWMKLGEQSQMYNGNITDRQRVAEYLFNSVIRNIASDENFLFNSRKITLSKNINPTNSDGEFRYNIPVDFLNKIWMSDPTARFEHEFIYSNADGLQLAYCYKLPLTEFPDYLEDYLVSSLAYKLSLAYETFNSKVGLAAQEVEDEKARILKMEGLPFGIAGR